MVGPRARSSRKEDSTRSSALQLLETPKSHPEDLHQGLGMVMLPTPDFLQAPVPWEQRWFKLHTLRERRRHLLCRKLRRLPAGWDLPAATTLNQLHLKASAQHTLMALGCLGSQSSAHHLLSIPTAVMEQPKSAQQLPEPRAEPRGQSQTPSSSLPSTQQPKAGWEDTKASKRSGGTATFLSPAQLETNP